MTKIHNLGFPRIGAKRELKFALEAYWHQQSSAEQLQKVAQQLRQEHWAKQAQLDLIPVGDFSFYDQVLDTSALVGNLPKRVQQPNSSALDAYFRAARGRSGQESEQQCTWAGEMTKWFNTNYHFIVPELNEQSQFSLNPEKLLAELAEAAALYPSQQLKPVILGPVTYLWLAKGLNEQDKLALLPQLQAVYQQLLVKLAAQNIEWLQLDEPIFSLDLPREWQNALLQTYQAFASQPLKLIVANYFGALQDNLSTFVELPVAALHIDASVARHEVAQVVEQLSPEQVLSLGVIDGRNIWKSDLNQLLDWLEPLQSKAKPQLWLAPSCSLLHVPVDLSQEQSLDAEVKQWLAFAVQKLEELALIKRALLEGREAVAADLAANQQAILARQNSERVHKPQVQAALQQASAADGQRKSDFAQRQNLQAKRFALPAFPTTTIGSFPQTKEIRQARARYRKGELDQQSYQQQMEQEIAFAVEQQHQLELDVLVHGEAERNDMVEYFGQQLEGYAFSQLGWVQSYGSRCVKPPILFGDIQRRGDMTVTWTKYAQSLTDKPMKGMLTGPVTMLNWSFVRDDQSRELSCKQLALAIREEVQALEAAGIGIIQVDEAALREGLPLRQSDWQGYLDWAVESFKLCANGVEDETQIHTHMCYSEFNDIMPAIAAMDADVITIETSRSNMELLDAFDDFSYPNQIGPGVYDIHSPNIPAVENMVNLMQQAKRRIKPEQLWVNPDCGLKTRRWEEVLPALQNMVTAAKTLREAEPA